MSTSGSTDFTLNTNEVVSEILELLGVIAPGTSAPTEWYMTTLRTINMMLKDWVTDGIKLYLETEGFLFLQVNEARYRIGEVVDDDALATEYLDTTTLSDAALGDTSLTITTSDGIGVDDIVGIELDDGTMQWSTVSSIPDSTSISIDDALTDNASEGNAVYTYDPANITGRPIEISSVRLHDTDSQTDRVLKCISRREYFNLPSKAVSGNPTQYYVDKQRDYTSIYVYPVSDNTRNVLYVTGRRMVEDLDSALNDLDLPPEFISAVIYNAAVRVAPKFGKSQTVSELVGGNASITSQAAYLLKKLQNANQETARIKIRPYIPYDGY